MANIHGQSLPFKPELEEILKMLKVRGFSHWSDNEWTRGSAVWSSSLGGVGDGTSQNTYKATYESIFVCAQFDESFQE